MLTPEAAVRPHLGQIINRLEEMTSATEGGAAAPPLSKPSSSLPYYTDSPKEANGDTSVVNA